MNRCRSSCAVVSAIVGSLGLLAAACSSEGSGSATSSSTPSPQTEVASTPPTTTAVPPASFSACELAGQAARCTTVAVPEDRTASDSRVVSLRVAIVDARDAASTAEPVVLLSGGPGGSAIDDAPTFLDRFGSFHAEHDLVFVEQRGTGQSGAILCDALPLALRGDDALHAAGVEWARECLDRAIGDVSKYGTEEFVDDLAEVLTTLGYKDIDLYGGSYGALAAQVFAVRHPDRVRTMTLDGVSLLGVPIIANTPGNSQRAFDLLVSRCHADASCAGAYPDVAGDLATVLSRLRTDPAPTTVTDPASGQPLMLDDVLAAQAVHALLLFTETAPSLPGVLHAAALGIYDYLVQSVAEIVRSLDSSRLAMYVTIRCSEPWASPTPTVPVGDSYFADAAHDQSVFYSGVCSVWPKAAVAADETRPPLTDIPTLLLVGEADAQNPPSAVDGFAASMRNAVEVLAPGHGHGIVQSGCIAGVVQLFVEAGTASGLDTSCTAAMSPPPFVLPPG